MINLKSIFFSSIYCIKHATPPMYNCCSWCCIRLQPNFSILYITVSIFGFQIDCPSPLVKAPLKRSNSCAVRKVSDGSYNTSSQNPPLSPRNCIVRTYYDQKINQNTCTRECSTSFSSITYLQLWKKSHKINFPNIKYALAKDLKNLKLVSWQIENF